MTVGELVEKLSEINPGAIVYVKGGIFSYKITGIDIEDEKSKNETSTVYLEHFSLSPIMNQSVKEKKSCK